MDILVILYCIILAVCGAIAAVVIKKGAASIKKNMKASSGLIFLGVVLYGITTIGITFLLKSNELSILFPLITAWHYLFTVWLSASYLKEKVTKKTKLALATLIIGIILIAI